MPGLGKHLLPSALFHHSELLSEHSDFPALLCGTFMSVGSTHAVLRRHPTNWAVALGVFFPPLNPSLLCSSCWREGASAPPTPLLSQIHHRIFPAIISEVLGTRGQSRNSYCAAGPRAIIDIYCSHLIPSDSVLTQSMPFRNAKERTKYVYMVCRNKLHICCF